MRTGKDDDDDDETSQIIENRYDKRGKSKKKNEKISTTLRLVATLLKSLTGYICIYNI